MTSARSGTWIWGSFMGELAARCLDQGTGLEHAPGVFNGSKTLFYHLSALQDRHIGTIPFSDPQGIVDGITSHSRVDMAELYKEIAAG